MKNFLKSFTAITLAIACSLMLVSGNARSEDEPLPPEVKKLIGMKIQSEKQGEFGRIKNWKTKRWTTLNIFPNPSQTIGVEELYRDDMSIFVIELMDKTDWSMTLLDVRVLPRYLLNYDVKNGEIIWEKSSRAYRFEPMCFRTPKERIVGILQPEMGKEDCTHETKQIKRAWKVNQQTGHISEVPTQEVSCSFMDSEYSCDPQ